MDTGKHDNTFFYNGYEGEGEIVLTLSDSSYTTTLHIWDGYFEEIFGNPTMSSTGWSGFTKDYQESVRTFNGEEHISPSAISEYLADLRNYKNHTFSFPEAKDCLNVLINLFETALKLSSEILVFIQ